MPAIRTSHLQSSSLGSLPESAITRSLLSHLRSEFATQPFYEDIRTKRLAAVEPDLVSHLPGVSDETLAVWQAEARRVDAPAQTNLLDFLLEN
jgi:hypothetical protein